MDSLFGDQDFASTSLKKAQVGPKSSTAYGTPTGFPAIESPLPADNALACWKARDRISIIARLPAVQSNPLYPKCRHRSSRRRAAFCGTPDTSLCIITRYLQRRPDRSVSRQSVNESLLCDRGNTSPMKCCGARTSRWVVAAAIATLIVWAVLSRVIEPGVRVEKVMLTANTRASTFPRSAGSASDCAARSWSDRLAMQIGLLGGAIKGPQAVAVHK